DRTARCHDPSDPTRVFSWFISETRDDKGNAAIFQYKTEDGAGIDLAQAHEQCRGARTDPSRTANRYIQRILYGNRRSLLDRGTSRRPRDLTDAQIRNADWMFELVFDYGERTGFEAIGAETWRCQPDLAGTAEWTMRSDPFSSYRSCFEV